MLAYPPRLTRGFSLTEMLVALALGLILIAGMITAFAGNKRSNDVNTATANIQESARFALNNISRDIRGAGFQGCVDVNNGSAEILAKNAPTSNLRNSATMGAIVGETDWLDQLPDDFDPPDDVIPVATQPVPKTHALSLQFGTDVHELDSSIGTHAGLVNVKGEFDSTVKDGDLMIIADCDVANLFQVSSDATYNSASKLTPLTHAAAANVDQDGIASGNLTKVFGKKDELVKQTMVMRFSSDIYYIGYTGLTNDSGDDITALYKQTYPYVATNPPTEMVQGVENMRIAFGIRESNGSLSYVAADHSDYDSSKVESIQIGLLMVSWERISQQDDENTYVLAGQDIPMSSNSVDATTHPSDRRFRLAFNTTVKVRNRRDEII